jgi:zinc protease
VNYFITLNSSKLKDGLDFMNASARFPKFLKEEMKKEDTVVAGEFQRDESNPVFYLFQDMNKRLWGKEFSRKNTIGVYKVILNATPDIMQNIKNRYYYPNNSMLVIAGDVKHEDVFQQVSSIYGSWAHSSFDIFKKYPIPEFDPLKYNSHFITSSDLAQVPYVMMSWHGPDTRHDLKNTYAADVFSYVLSQQSSKLQKALVESGLAYQVSVNYSTMAHTGPINVFMVPNPAKLKEAVKVLQEQMKQWSDPASYITPEQLETAKQMIDIEDQYSKEQTSEYVHGVTYWWASASLDYYANYISNIKKVSTDDIKDYVQKYISGQPFITGMLISPELRKQTGLDSFYHVTDSIEHVVVHASGKNNTEIASSEEGNLDKLSALIEANPGRKVEADVYAAKKSTAAHTTKALQDMMAKHGLDASQVEFQEHITKDKALKPEEKDLQNTIRFSFKSEKP